MAEVAYEDASLTLWSGDCREAMRQMPEKSIQTVCTSPPYYGLRSYGTGVWEGGNDPECTHEPPAWAEDPGDAGLGEENVLSANAAKWHQRNGGACPRCGAVKVERTVWGGDPTHDHVFQPITTTRKGSTNGRQDMGSTLVSAGAEGTLAPGLDNDATGTGQYRTDRSDFCICGSWRGALGLEPSPEMFVAVLVEVFREVRRVLRDDGTAWLNLGDSYATQPGKGDSVPQTKWKANSYPDAAAHRSRSFEGIKAKDLLGIPWMVAFGLRADGWYLRSDIVWAKPNVMPESVDDRPTRSHEFIFLLTKQPRYFYDAEAVKETLSQSMLDAAKRRTEAPGKTYQHDEATRMGKTSPNRVWSDPAAVQRILEGGRNLRDVWTVTTTPYPGAHYAVFPAKLVEPMIKAGTSEKGCCSVCGAPWGRLTKSRRLLDGEQPVTGGWEQNEAGQIGANGFGHWRVTTEVETLGWEPSCQHEAEVQPCTVLDIFAGSGTTGMVAQQLGRRAVLVDLNPDYLKQQMARNNQIGLGLTVDT